MTKKVKFSCVLYAHSQLCSFARFDLANRGVRHQSSRTLSMLDQEWIQGGDWDHLPPKI